MDRIFYSILEHAYHFDRKKNYTILKFKPEIAPIKVGIFPLMDKDGLDNLAKNVYDDICKHDIEAYYDESGTIGKRYARMDEIGTPWCITIDYNTLNDKMVTIRDRDTTEQKRIPIITATNIIRGLLMGTKFADI